MKNKDNKKIIKIWLEKFICVVSCITLLFPIFSPIVLAEATELRNSKYEVDQDTTDDYITHMINNENGSRYAGRIWADKSVFRDKITLDYATDGYNGTITNNSDFLHVFSTLGSSQKINENVNPPIDAVILLDMSGSMAADTEEVGNIYVNKLNDFTDENAVVVVTREFTNGFPQDLENWAMIKIKNDASVNGSFKVEEIKKIGENRQIEIPRYSGEMIIATKNPTNEWENIAVDDVLYGATNTTGNRGLTLSGNTVIAIANGAHFTLFKGHKDLEERISHSRIYKVVKSINSTIETLMSMNETNRVMVVGYGTTAAVILELGHYEKLNNQDYITVADFTGYGSRTAFNKDNITNGCYNVIGNAKKIGYDGNAYSYYRMIRNDYVEYTHNTGTIRIGYSTNLQAGIYLGFNELYKRLQTPEDVTYTYRSKWQNKDVTIPRIPAAFVMTDGGSNYALKDSQSSQITGDEWYNVPIMSQIGNIVGPYEKYRSESNKDNIYGGGEAVILDILLTASYMKAKVQNKYTELLQQKNLLQENEKAKLYIQSITVDTPVSPWQIPRVYAGLDPKDFFTDNLHSIDDIDPNTWVQKDDVITAYNYFKEWEKSDVGVTVTFTDSDKKVKDVKFNKLKDESGAEVTNQDVIDNIKYNDEFHDIGTVDLTKTFLSFVSKLSEIAFVPVGGTNEFGSDDSLTYKDPIGEYMEIKDNGVTIENKTYDMALLLFGKMHGIEKKAIYDYSFNQSHLTNGEFESGWYDKNGQKKDSGDWENGDVYYLDNKEVQYYVTDGNAISDQNKKFIIYRFAEADNEGTKQQLNPSYSEAAQIYYKLNDIQILVEQDEKGNEKLFVNIPSTALPLQTVTIQVDEIEDGMEYITNISDKEESTPLRLFYEVGVASNLLLNNGKDVNITKIDKDYLEKHSTADGYINFYSNYYSETTYDGYTADTQEDSRTKGDAVLSISPSMENRYYIFQKNLKIYDYAYIIEKDGSVREENNPLLFEGADFDGEYEGKTENDQPNAEGLASIKQAFDNGELKEGDIIVLSGDTVSYGTDPSSDDFYYFAIDYFMPTENGKGKQVQYVVARRGSEFGSGIAEKPGAKLPKGDFLSWIDASGNNSEIYNFDVSIPEEILNSGNWVLATKIGGLRIGDLHQSILRKEENKTNTSKSYYLPIIADDLSTEGADAILDAYLGNNGLITYKIEKWMIPEAGSIGNIAITTIGIILIVISSLLYRKNKRGVITESK